jgi:hypothetical protein
MIKVLGAVSLSCGLLIVVSNVTTLGRIRQNQEIIMRESVTHLLPGLTKQIIYGVEPSGDLKILQGVEGENVRRFFAGHDGSGKFLGVVIEASVRGYADIISAMYAYYYWVTKGTLSCRIVLWDHASLRQAHKRNASRHI